MEDQQCREPRKRQRIIKEDEKDADVKEIESASKKIKSESSTSILSWSTKKLSDVPTKVLLFKIENQKYPITTTVIDAICKQFGFTLARIVVFGKKEKSVMVEFLNVDMATKAKNHLQGADIYHKCCTLTIYFAKLSRLDVYKNDEMTWDYTVKGSASYPLIGGMCPGAPFYFGNMMAYNMMYSGWMPPPQAPLHQNPAFSMAHMVPPGFGVMPSARPLVPRNGNHGGSGLVLLAHGFHSERINCKRVFNIFCIYGNVLKVKFILKQPGAAFVEMDDPHAVNQAIAALDGCQLFDHKLQIKISYNSGLSEVSRRASNLPDGSPSQMDFSKSNFNRFTSPQLIAKNRIQKPSKVLHYYSAPSDFDRQLFEKICKEKNVAVPDKFSAFKNKSDKSGSGVMEFSSLTKALECLSCVNHYKLDRPDLSHYPYVFKLCYSTQSSLSG